MFTRFKQLISKLNLSHLSKKQWLVFGLSALTLVVLFVWVSPAFGDGEAGGVVAQEQNWFMSAVTNMLLWVAELFIKMTLFLLTFIIELSAYNGYLNATAVNVGWVMVRDVTNMGFVLILLLIAFGTILGIEQYEWKKMLVKFVIAAILVNFSRVICGLLIDVSQLVMNTFVNGIVATAGGNLIQAFNFDSILKLNSTVRPDQLGAPGVFTAALAAVIFAGMAMAVMAIFAFILGARLVGLWVLIVVSPAAFVFSVIPQTQSFASKWWSELADRLVTGPIILFFIWLSFVTVGTGQVHDEIKRGIGDTLPESAQIRDKMEADQIGTGGQSVGISDAMGWNNMANFAIAIGLLIAGAEVAQQIGGSSGSALTGVASFGKKVATIASGYALGRSLFQGGTGVAKKVGKGLLMGMPLGGRFWSENAQILAHRAKGFYMDNIVGQNRFLGALGRSSILRKKRLEIAKKSGEEAETNIRSQLSSGQLGNLYRTRQGIGQALKMRSENRNKAGIQAAKVARLAQPRLRAGGDEGGVLSGLKAFRPYEETDAKGNVHIQTLNDEVARFKLQSGAEESQEKVGALEADARRRTLPLGAGKAGGQEDFERMQQNTQRAKELDEQLKLIEASAKVRLQIDPANDYMASMRRTAALQEAAAAREEQVKRTEEATKRQFIQAAPGTGAAAFGFRGDTVDGRVRTADDVMLETMGAGMSPADLARAGNLATPQQILALRTEAEHEKHLEETRVKETREEAVTEHIQSAHGRAELAEEAQIAARQAARKALEDQWKAEEKNRAATIGLVMPGTLAAGAPVYRSAAQVAQAAAVQTAAETSELKEQEAIAKGEVAATVEGAAALARTAAADDAAKARDTYFKTRQSHMRRVAGGYEEEVLPPPPGASADEIEAYQTDVAARAALSARVAEGKMSGTEAMGELAKWEARDKRGAERTKEMEGRTATAFARTGEGQGWEQEKQQAMLGSNAEKIEQERIAEQQKLAAEQADRAAGGAGNLLRAQRQTVVKGQATAQTKEEEERAKNEAERLEQAALEATKQAEVRTGVSTAGIKEKEEAAKEQAQQRERAALEATKQSEVRTGAITAGIKEQEEAAKRLSQQIQRAAVEATKAAEIRTAAETAESKEIEETAKRDATGRERPSLERTKRAEVRTGTQTALQKEYEEQVKMQATEQEAAAVEETKRAEVRMGASTAKVKRLEETAKAVATRVETPALERAKREELLTGAQTADIAAQESQAKAAAAQALQGVIADTNKAESAKKAADDILKIIKDNALRTQHQEAADILINLEAQIQSVYAAMTPDERVSLGNTIQGIKMNTSLNEEQRVAAIRAAKASASPQVATLEGQRESFIMNNDFARAIHFQRQAKVAGIRSAAQQGRTTESYSLTDMARESAAQAAEANLFAATGDESLKRIDNNALQDLARRKKQEVLTLSRDRAALAQMELSDPIIRALTNTARATNEENVGKIFLGDLHSEVDGRFVDMAEINFSTPSTARLEYLEKEKSKFSQLGEGGRGLALARSWIHLEKKRRAGIPLTAVERERNISTYFAAGLNGNVDDGHTSLSDMANMYERYTRLKAQGPGALERNGFSPEQIDEYEREGGLLEDFKIALEIGSRDGLIERRMSEQQVGIKNGLIKKKTDEQLAKALEEKKKVDPRATELTQRETSDVKRSAEAAAVTEFEDGLVRRGDSVYEYVDRSTYEPTSRAQVFTLTGGDLDFVEADADMRAFMEREKIGSVREGGKRFFETEVPRLKAELAAKLVADDKLRSGKAIFTVDEENDMQTRAQTQSNSAMTSRYGRLSNNDQFFQALKGYQLVFRDFYEKMKDETINNSGHYQLSVIGEDGDMVRPMTQSEHDGLIGGSIVKPLKPIKPNPQGVLSFNNKLGRADTQQERMMESSTFFTVSTVPELKTYSPRLYRALIDQQKERKGVKGKDGHAPLSDNANFITAVGDGDYFLGMGDRLARMHAPAMAQSASTYGIAIAVDFENADRFEAEAGEVKVDMAGFQDWYDTAVLEPAMRQKLETGGIRSRDHFKSNNLSEWATKIADFIQNFRGSIIGGFESKIKEAIKKGDKDLESRLREQLKGIVARTGDDMVQKLRQQASAISERIGNNNSGRTETEGSAGPSTGGGSTGGSSGAARGGGATEAPVLYDAYNRPIAPSAPSGGSPRSAGRGGRARRAPDAADDMVT